MFLSLPVFQDPAPWNVVWRAGELFPIDVGDGTTLEERGGNWDTFAQKYIGSLNECYRMSLKWLCAGAAESSLQGDDRYEACMQGYFSNSFCPAALPFPCLNGCNKTYQACSHLPWHARPSRCGALAGRRGWHASHVSGQLGSQGE